MSSRVASRYAKSLLDLAQSQSVDGKVYEEMLSFGQLTSESTDLKDLLNNPIISGTDKLKVLGKVFEGASDLTKSFVELVVGRKRESELANIANVYVQRYDELKGVTKVTVKSAIALDNKSIEDVKRYLKGVVAKDDIQVENVIDASVIGGMVIQFEDKLLDLSIAKELKEIRKQLIYN
jgi:F-type H+-transporting ATPase subunit delta